MYKHRYHTDLRAPLSPPTSPYMPDMAMIKHGDFDHLRQEHTTMNEDVAHELGSQFYGPLSGQYVINNVGQQRYADLCNTISQPQNSPSNMFSPTLFRGEAAHQRSPQASPVKPGRTSQIQTSCVLLSSTEDQNAYFTHVESYDVQKGGGCHSNGDQDGSGADGETNSVELGARKRRMKRFRLTHQQTRFLLNEFSKQAHPDAAHRARFSRAIPGLSPRQVQVWFQNRRAKLKPMNSSDQKQMVQSRTLPENFDVAKTLYFPFQTPGQVSNMAIPSDCTSHSTAYPMRQLVMDTTTGLLDQNACSLQYAYPSPINVEHTTVGPSAPSHPGLPPLAKLYSPASNVQYSHTQHDVQTALATNYRVEQSQPSVAACLAHLSTPGKWTIPCVSAAAERPLHNDMSCAHSQPYNANFWTSHVQSNVTHDGMLHF